jgi:hypothetical protein
VELRFPIRRWTVALTALLACCTVPVPAAAEYRTIETEGLRITIDSDWPNRLAPGYLPVRFDITNSADARDILIAGNGIRFMRGRGSTQIASGVRQAVRLERGSRVRLTIPVPIYADSESIRFEIRENGRTLERFNYAGYVSRIAAEYAAVLLVADPAGPFGQAAAGWVRTTPPGSSMMPGGGRGAVVITPRPSPGPAPAPPMDFMLAPSRLPENWLGFTSLRAVMLAPPEWSELNEAQKTALLTWTACGGDLFFVDGAIEALFPPGQAPPASPGSTRVYFFGRIHLTTAAAVTAEGLGAAMSRTRTLQDANWSLPANGAGDWGVIGARGFRLPIPGIAGVPARAYVLILIAFAVIIGPLNYWLLHRARRQVLFVFTTPLISLIFIGLLGGYVLAGEGLGVRARAVSFTMIDQARKQAVTRASASLYAAGLTPGGGLRFGREEAVYAIGRDGQGTREGLMLDLTAEQRFASGAIDARSPNNLETIAFRTARERLEFKRDGSAIQVLNGLGARLEALVYRDGATIYSLPGPLEPGARAVLRTGAAAAAQVIEQGLPLSGRFEHLLQHQPAGSYFAVLERSPFWNPGVSDVEERDSFHVVFGWVDGQR